MWAQLVRRRHSRWVRVYRAPAKCFHRHRAYRPRDLLFARVRLASYHRSPEFFGEMHECESCRALYVM